MRSFFANAIRMAKLEAACDAMSLLRGQKLLGWVFCPSHEMNGTL